MYLVWTSCLHTSNFGFNLQDPFPRQYSVSKLPHNMQTSDMDVDGGSSLVLELISLPPECQEQDDQCVLQAPENFLRKQQLD